MGIAAIILGCMAMVFYFFSLIPMLRIVDLITLPVAIAGIIIGILGIIFTSFVTLSIIGLVLSAVVLFAGWGRLMGQRPAVTP